MSEGRGLLPEWRYWPGVVLAALFFISIFGVIQQPQQPYQSEPSKSAEADINPGTAEDRIANYTLWLERLTGLLAVSTLLLWWATERAISKAEATSERQFSQIQEQIGLAHDEFLASHPPELVVREVFWTTLRGTGESVVSLTLINRGRNKCRVVESVFEVRETNLIRHLDTTGKNSLGAINLGPGEFIFRQVVPDQFGAGSRDLHPTFLRGVIIYEDDAKIRRRAVFMRHAPPGEDRLRFLDDPEYEYTD